MNKFKTQSGFTLLEIIVALVIASTSMVVLIQIFSSGFSAKTSIDQQRLMMRLAQSKLAEITDTANTIVQNNKGQFNNGFMWESSYTMYLNEDSKHYNAYWLNIEIYSNKKPGSRKTSFRLKTLILTKTQAVNQ